MLDRYELLRLIEHNARLTQPELAVMLGVSESEIAEELTKLREEEIILGYTTVVNWDKTKRESVTALIEVRLNPQRDQGFDRIAQHLFRYPQVTSCYLMSGGFDLMLIIEDSTLREVASFISNKVAPMDGVVSTATHFILKKYKSNGVVFDDKPVDRREAVIL
jgi:DNA-binding Lrp family transcriptional regulator